MGVALSVQFPEAHGTVLCVPGTAQAVSWLVAADFWTMPPIPSKTLARLALNSSDGNCVWYSWARSRGERRTTNATMTVNTFHMGRPRISQHC